MIKRYVNINTIFDLYNQSGTPSVVNFFTNVNTEYIFTGSMSHIQKQIYESCLRGDYKGVRHLIADTYEKSKK